uniref:Exocyst subunit Exo70 family protein n=1 Tax=Oryza barthii TaxID=65489 RepID=A0A0D3HIN8_9ORYZ
MDRIPPQKSSSFSPATFREERLGRNLSLGAIKISEHAPAVRVKEEAEEGRGGVDNAGAGEGEGAAGEEAAPPEEAAEPDLAMLSAEVDAFLAGREGDAPTSISEVTLDKFASAVEQEMAQSEGDDDKWAVGENGQAAPLLAAIRRISALAAALTAVPEGSKFTIGVHRVTGVLHRAMAFVEDEFHTMLEDPRLNSVRSRLGEFAAAIFRELESSIRADAGKQPVPGGAVHPLTRYLMNYLKYACEYKNTLEQVFHEHHRTDIDADDEGSDPFAAQLMEVMELLHDNLEAKSRLYKDPALCSIFLMNNGRYMLQKIRGSPEINAVVGEAWSRKRSTDLRQYHKNYQRETWSRVLTLLRDDGVITVKGSVQKPVLKERFKQFNAAMDEIQRTQGAWVVSDEQLQSELRVSIAAVVVPAYRSFLGRFSQSFSAGRQAEKYIKLSAEDLEAIIDELFDGNAVSMPRRRN